MKSVSLVNLPVKQLKVKYLPRVCIKEQPGIVYLMRYMYPWSVPMGLWYATEGKWAGQWWSGKCLQHPWRTQISLDRRELVRFIIKLWIFALSNIVGIVFRRIGGARVARWNETYRLMLCLVMLVKVHVSVGVFVIDFLVFCMQNLTSGTWNEFNECRSRKTKMVWETRSKTIPGEFEERVKRKV